MVAALPCTAARIADAAGAFDTPAPLAVLIKKPGFGRCTVGSFLRITVEPEDPQSLDLHLYTQYTDFMYF